MTKFQDTSDSRRRFLWFSASIGPAIAAVGCGAKSEGPAMDTASNGGASVGHGTYEPSFFDTAEWRFVQAAAARLIPADELGPGALEAGVPEYIDRQMATAWAEGKLWYMQGPFQPDAPASLGWQIKLTPRDVLRHGIAAADAWSHDQKGLLFADLDATRQDELLHAFEAGQAQFSSVSAKSFFAMLLGLVREGFFSDPMHGGNKGLVGWKLIGFPGARADFMDWVDRDVEYPLPPVALNGQRG